MTDHVTRLLSQDELRTANTLFRGTLHVAPATDEEWARSTESYQPDRTLGVFDTELIGTARSFDSDLTVPGGARVPLSAVTGVGVRADRTRRGVLTELMRTQLEGFADRGVVAANLYASEGLIYGRFGYGVATLWRRCVVDRRRAVVRAGAPSGGEVELLDLETAKTRLPEIHDGLDDDRPGAMRRSEYWWPGLYRQLNRAEAPVKTVLHHGADGIDGYVVYHTSRPNPADPAVLRVEEFHARTPDAYARMWRFLLSVDLIDTIEVSEMALDDPLELLFTDPRAVKVTGVEDETWLRLVDVPAALAARERGDAEVVLEVADPILPRNSGRYLVSKDAVTRTDAPAQLSMGVDVLAMIYLGTWRPSALASVGRIDVADSGVAERADLLFGTRVAAWCGTFF
ncbi:Predicted acetyltransferase [Amycolatopsis marina]|uniref:Predicted acetyltransferase n=1 Tax=Amycolatopsis marina TaxID=490629 RepID=A0A1I1BXY8_9PSEU|nr:GNAT family N-acetyltransferase [Amycolatopsis marina]SFB54977.1 Predicted acetyltransferase [Amycolatopsis marina]